MKIGFEIIKYRRELKTIPAEPEDILLKRCTFINYILDLTDQGGNFKKIIIFEYNFDEDNLEKETIRQNLSIRRDDQLLDSRQIL